MVRKWIQKAIKRPGRIRRLAERLGLIKPGQKLTRAAVNAIIQRAKQQGDRSLLSAALLARRFVAGDLAKAATRK